jgi:hypothetical protein
VWDLTFSRDPGQTYIYAANGVDEKINILLRSSLEVLTSFGDGGRGPGQFYGVHNLATDSRGNLYATETYTGARVQRFLYKGVGPRRRAGRRLPAAADTRRARVHSDLQQRLAEQHYVMTAGWSCHCSSPCSSAGRCFSKARRASERRRSPVPSRRHSRPT